MTFNEDSFLIKYRERCSREELCPTQIRRRLSKYLEKDSVDKIIATLEEEKFIDIVRFASSYVRDKARFSLWGPKKIEYSLKSLDISSDIIEFAINEHYSSVEGSENKNYVLEKIVLKKWNSLKGEESNESKRLKTLRFALQRGFDYREIDKIIKNINRL